MTPDPVVRNRLRPALTRFDRHVALVIGALLLALVFTILLGDRVGVTLERVSPMGMARSTGNITLQFSEAMQRDSVPERLQVVEVPADRAGQALTPDDILATLEGAVTWNGSTLAFRPSAALRPGATYQVSLQPGTLSESGRAVLAEYRFSFTVRHPRVAYLAPASGTPFNIWLVDPFEAGSARQITFSPSGVYDFGVSPDGAQLAFSERNSSTGTMDIKLLDLETGAVEQLTNCEDAECKSPVWRPDGQVIAYERVDYNSDMAQQVGVSPTRIWLIDLASRPTTTRPMFADSQTLGYGLRWSKDGQRVSVFDYHSQGILIYDFRDDSTVILPSKYGNPGEMSPDGLRVVYPEIMLEANQARSYLQLVDLSKQEMRRLTQPEDPVDDDIAAWSPDGTRLLIGRRYTDDRYTRGKQLYILNPEDSSVEPILVDDRYQNGFFSWDPTGAQVLVQRFPDALAMNDPVNPGLPEIWTIDVQTKAAIRVAEDAFNGRWVP